MYRLPYLKLGLPMFWCKYTPIRGKGDRGSGVAERTHSNSPEGASGLLTFQEHFPDRVALLPDVPRKRQRL